MNVIVKNGVKIADYDDYSVYKMYTDDAREYYLALPMVDTDRYKMVVDFPEEYYKFLLQEQTVEEIKKICDIIYSDNKNVLYVLTNVTTYDLDEAARENDDRVYSTLLKNIQKYTYSAYNSVFKGKNVGTLEQTIDMIVQTPNDNRFIDWLDMNLTGFFKGVSIKLAKN